MAADDRAAMPLAVTLSGVDRHAPAGSVIRVWVLTTRMSPAVRAKLERVGSSWAQTRLSFVEVSPEALERLPEVGHLTRETYLRLLLPELLNDLERVIYLDADLLVQRDLMPLASYELNGWPLAAVPDVAAPVVGANEGLSFYFAGADRPSRDARTINAGVLVFDLEAWRRRRLADDLVSFLVEYSDHLRWADQDAINCLLAHEIEYLPLEFNVMSLWGTHPPLMDEERVRVDACLSEPGAAPVVWHFAGRVKPWKPQSLRSRYRRMYHEALGRSGWFGTRLAFRAWQAKWFANNGRRMLGLLDV